MFDEQRIITNEETNVKRKRSLTVDIKKKFFYLTESGSAVSCLQEINCFFFFFFSVFAI